MERARGLLGEMSEAERVGTLNAHPRIGAATAEMSARSRREQGSGEVAELAELNAAYERKFGFRFVVFVNRRSRSEIAGVLRERLDNAHQAEMMNGLRAIVDIAEDRLQR